MIKRNKKSIKKIQKASTKTRAEIISILARITKIPQKDIQDDVLIREELGIDSLTAYEVVYKVEQTLKIEIDEKNLFSIRYVKDFVDLIEETIKI